MTEHDHFLRMGWDIAALSMTLSEKVMIAAQQALNASGLENVGFKQELLKSNETIKRLSAEVENLRNLLARESCACREALSKKDEEVLLLQAKLNKLEKKRPPQEPPAPDPNVVSFYDLDISARLANAVTNLIGHGNDKISVAQVAQLSEHAAWKQKGLGRKTMKELKEQLARFGLKLRP